MIWKSRGVQVINRQKRWLALCRGVLVLCAAGSTAWAGEEGAGSATGQNRGQRVGEVCGGAGQRAVCLARKGERTPKDLKICPLEQRRFQAEKQVGVPINGRGNYRPRLSLKIISPHFRSAR